MNHSSNTQKKLFAVEVTHKVYVLAESAQAAEKIVDESPGVSWQQSRLHSESLVSEVKSLSDIDTDRLFDRPLGSDRKLMKEFF